MKILAIIPIILPTIVMLNAGSLSKDDTNFNLALTTKNLKHCVSIQKKDIKIECFGIVKRNTGYCNMIKDKDLKNKCLSVALSDITYCDKIKDKGIQSSCRDLSN